MYTQQERNKCLEKFEGYFTSLDTLISSLPMVTQYFRLHISLIVIVIP